MKDSSRIMRSCTYTNLCLVRQMLLARESMLPIAILLSKQGYKLRASSVYVQQALCLAYIIANYGQTAPPRVITLQVVFLQELPSAMLFAKCQ